MRTPCRYIILNHRPILVTDGIYARKENVGLKKDIFDSPQRHLSSLIDPYSKIKVKNSTSILNFAVENSNRNNYTEHTGRLSSLGRG